MNRVFNAALNYFAVVFGVGFLLGMIRVPLLVPKVGERIAELIELPFLLVAIFLACRWIVGRFDLHGRLVIAMLVGTIAASILLLVEFSIVLYIRGLTISGFPAARDPVAATFYYIAVIIFAVMPAIISLESSKDE